MKTYYFYYLLITLYISTTAHLQLWLCMGVSSMLLDVIQLTCWSNIFLLLLFLLFRFYIFHFNSITSLWYKWHQECFKPTRECYLSCIQGTSIFPANLYFLCLTTNFTNMCKISTFSFSSESERQKWFHVQHKHLFSPLKRYFIILLQDHLLTWLLYPVNYLFNIKK